ncbi:MAG: ABC transporter ATP-binding protein [Inhella sp.]
MTPRLQVPTGLQLALGGRPVLRGVDLQLGSGWTAIVGPNGAGKSTLLRAFAGRLLPAQAGELRLDGRLLQDGRRASARAAWPGWRNWATARAS